MRSPNTLYISKLSESQIRLSGEPAYLKEVREFFSFLIPNAHFNPKVKAKMWDGIIRLIHGGTNITYTGLTAHIEQFCIDRGYKCAKDWDDSLEEISLQEGKEFAAKFDLRNGDGQKIIPDDYQIRAFVKSVRYRRKTVVFPTGGGKSLIAFLIVNWLKEHDLAKKICLVVPTTTLVDQMTLDFKDYSWDTDKLIHKIYAGASKVTTKFLTITTWQSAIKQPKEWHQQFDAVIGDEAHEASAKSLTEILLAMSNAKFRIGMTGSMDNKKINELVIEGLLGPVEVITTAKELQDQGRLAQIRIQGIVLKHIQEKLPKKKMDYREETNYLVAHERRNLFITNLALSLPGNTLIMFNYIEKHGDILYKLLEKKRDPTTQPLYYIHGKIDTEDRTKYRIQVNKDKNAIMLCSYGTFQRGLNVPNLHNLILASGFKSLVRNIQSIGRGLRIGTEKTLLSMYDIADDLRSYDEVKDVYGKMNYSLQHFMDRIDIYHSQEFPIKNYNVKLKG